MANRGIHTLPTLARVVASRRFAALVIRRSGPPLPHHAPLPPVPRLASA
ncbi:hypothetical protein [Streptomyces sp. NPDC060275]